jgi:hypothetical protein
MHQPVTANRPITRNRGCTKPGTLHSVVHPVCEMANVTLRGALIAAAMNG